MKQVFEVKMIVEVNKAEPVTWEDVERAVQDLLFDDEKGTPNFTVGRIVSIIAEEVKRAGDRIE